MKKLVVAGVVGLLLLFNVPVAVTQLSKPDPRRLEGVRLDDTDYEEISFRNLEQDIRLAGMLFVPEGDGPFPAAVIIHGSGPSFRNNRWPLTLAQHLQGNGVMVLLPDKRGSEKSGGNWRTASLDDLATDTNAAVAYLRDQDEVAVADVGVIGLSQGGRIAPLVADKSKDLDFLVSVVGGALPARELLVYEETHNLREMGILPGLSDLLAYPSSWMVVNVAQRGFWDSIGNFDPLPYWRGISVDSLILYGENDTNTPSSKSAEILESLKNVNIEVRIYEGSGHALESPAGEGNSIFREDALSDIVDFVLSVANSPS